MRKTLIAASVATLLSMPAVSVLAADPTPEHTFTGNVGLVSDYVFRGISQSAHKPAIQGGFDYSHSSGLYAGVWGSNVNWVSDNYGGVGLPSASNSVEVDLYGGYRGTITGDLGFDVGLITYNYPGTNKTVGGTFLAPDSTEIYGALSYKWLTLKYSHSTTALFGWGKWSPPAAPTLDKTTGSGYLELNASYDLGQGWGVNGHVGHQKIKGNAPASYTDYRIGITKDVGFGTVGLALNASDSKGDCGQLVPNPQEAAYCWGIAPGKSTYDAGKSTAVLTFSKSF